MKRLDERAGLNRGGADPNMKVEYFISKRRQRNMPYMGDDKESRILQRSRLIHNGGHGKKSAVRSTKTFH